jgi:hypothetical protein
MPYSTGDTYPIPVELLSSIPTLYCYGYLCSLKHIFVFHGLIDHHLQFSCCHLSLPMLFYHMINIDDLIFVFTQNCYFSIAPLLTLKTANQLQKQSALMNK